MRVGVVTAAIRIGFGFNELTTAWHQLIDVDAMLVTATGVFKDEDDSNDSTRVKALAERPKVPQLWLTPQQQLDWAR